MTTVQVSWYIRMITILVSKYVVINNVQTLIWVLLYLGMMKIYSSLDMSRCFARVKSCCSDLYEVVSKHSSTTENNITLVRIKKHEV